MHAFISNEHWFRGSHVDMPANITEKKTTADYKSHCRVQGNALQQQKSHSQEPWYVYKIHNNNTTLLTESKAYNIIVFGIVYNP